MTSAERSNGILASLRASLGPDLVQRIQKSKILLVGAGGIGCELLKNLALTGFGNIEVIDLDTIDVSNLNRQLLFRSHHVGQPKCVVACQVAAELAVTTDNNDTPPRYLAHHGNVCDNSQFNVQYVKGFDLILNALDNVVARRRVNRLALAADTPLIEAGTTGYLGQVTTIHKPSETACYECQTQETGKVYPICTIRSTPSAPVHCIVWAKELYKLLFGTEVEESMLYEGASSTTEEQGENQNKGGEDTNGKMNGTKTPTSMNGEKTNGDEHDDENGGSSTYMAAVTAYRTLLQNKGGEVDASVLQTIAVTLVRNLFVDEIQKQLDMDRYKTAQKKPAVLPEEVVTTGEPAPTTAGAGWKHTDVWSPAQCVAEFAACLHEAATTEAVVLPSFDKDDALAMRLVTAAANLRGFVFGIEPAQSYYSAKGIAGNIIPAISTTNAIVAGMQILQCFQVLKAQMLTVQQAKEEGGEQPPPLTNLREHCKYVNCVRNPTRNGLYLTAGELERPNPKCFVCKKATIPLQLNVHKWNLQDFLAKIVKKDLGFEEPSITMDSGDYIWEEGDDADDFSMNLPKALTDLPCGGIQHGTVISIEDFTQDLTVEVVVTHVEQWPVTADEEVADDHKFVVGGTKPVAAAAAAAPTTNVDSSKPTPEENDDDDDIIEVVSGPGEPPSKDSNGTSKRAASATANGQANDGAPSAKKAKVDGDVEVIEID